MNKTEAYGLSRTRDEHGKITRRSLNPYANCIHTSVGGLADYGSINSRSV